MPATIAEKRYYACSDAVNRASGFPKEQHKYSIFKIYLIPENMTVDVTVTSIYVIPIERPVYSVCNGHIYICW
jgi:hypothetical protein